jgi:hypothetical protein
MALHQCENHYIAAHSFVRFQSSTADSAGRFIGVFGLVNSLAKRGQLTVEQEEFRRTANSWYDSACPNPAATNAAVYDASIHPHAQAWFKSTALHLLERVDGYLEVLAYHGVECLRLESHCAPGRVIYEDSYQVVVTPDR